MSKTTTSSFASKIYSFIGIKKTKHDGHIILLEPHCAVYFAIPKVANSSFKTVCAQLLELEGPKSGWMPVLFNNSDSRKELEEQGVLLNKDTIREYADYFKFAFVRNPWDRLVSCYKQKIREHSYKHPQFIHGVAKDFYNQGFRSNMSFEDFAIEVSKISDMDSNRHFRSQYTFVCDNEGNLVVDFIGKFENLENDFEAVKERLHAPDIELPHLLKSERSHYSEYYNAELVEVIAKRYQRDIELFNYSY